MNDREFETRNNRFIKKIAKNSKFFKLTNRWFYESTKYEYSYHFRWLGLPIIQYPQDILAMQEIIWKVKPDLIIETGIARGGSLVFYSSLLELIGKGRVLGIDVDIKPHNRRAIEGHPMYKRITMFEGSSIDHDIKKRVYEFAKNLKKIIVCLDSNHSHEHVLKELEIYSPLVKRGSYLVVFDTITNDLPKDFVKNRPWGKYDNPKTAVHEFLSKNKRFVIDKKIQDKLMITVSPDGYLKCIK